MNLEILQLEIGKLEIQSGDTLVIRKKNSRWERGEVTNAQRIIEELFPGVKMLFVGMDTEITVAHADIDL